MSLSINKVVKSVVVNKAALMQQSCHFIFRFKNFFLDKTMTV